MFSHSPLRGYRDGYPSKLRYEPLALAIVKTTSTWFFGAVQKYRRLVRACAEPKAAFRPASMERASCVEAACYARLKISTSRPHGVIPSIRVCLIFRAQERVSAGGKE